MNGKQEMNTGFLLKTFLTFLIGCTTCMAQSRGSDELPPPRLIQVTNDVYVIENANPSIAELISYGGNVTVIVSEEGVVLIDAKFARMHDFIVEQVRSLTDLPITHVILTHNHDDHSGGTARLQEIGATAIVSATMHEKMNQQEGSGSRLESYSDELLLTSGEKEIYLREIRGHTAGDTIAYLPQDGVLVAGDLITTADSIPVIVNYEDGGSWISLGAALDELADFDFRFLVSGHGPIVTKSEFLVFRDKVRGIIERTRTLTREGANREAIAETLLAEFNWGGGLADGNIPTMMEELQ